LNAFPNPELAQQWQQRLDRFDDNSGMTIAGFCQSEGFSVASFYQWRKRLRQADRDSVGFIAVEVPDNETLCTASADVTIELSGGAIVRLDALTDPAVYRPLLAAVLSAVVAATDNTSKETP
jgi:hypothetical protein